MKPVSVIMLAMAALAAQPDYAAATTAAVQRAVVDALVLGKPDTMNAADRRELAGTLKRYWQNFDSRIPRNAPDVQKWLEGELSTTDTNRISRAAGSQAFALSQLRDHADLCVRLHTSLETAIGSDSKTELYLWLKVMQCYANRGIPDYLQRAGLSDGSYDGDFKLVALSLVERAITGKIANTVVNE